MAEDTQAELERFRRQWQDEVSSRNRPAPTISQHTSSTSEKSQQPLSTSSKPPPKATILSTNRQGDDNNDLAEGFDFDDLQEWEEVRKPGGVEGVPHPESSRRKPTSALEHYEEAVERETQGNLGESLNLYRKAFRAGLHSH